MRPQEHPISPSSPDTDPDESGEPSLSRGEEPIPGSGEESDSEFAEVASGDWLEDAPEVVDEEAEHAGEVVSGYGAPPVVAVVITKDPGDWLAETVASLEAQDYPQLDVLVVDNGGEVDPAPIVVEVAPGAFVKRLDSDEGFSAAVNTAATSVKGAPFLLVCHDDVRLEPDAVTQLVAEAFRANAGIVGPKLVDWDDPQVLRSVGLAVDRFGAPREVVDPGELDQSQHDISRTVFAVSDACMLVRADLFETIGGFSDAIGFFGEDVDLCWKAHLAGASVQFSHRAAVAHRGDFESRRPTDALSLIHI